MIPLILTFIIIWQRSKINYLKQRIYNSEQDHINGYSGYYGDGSDYTNSNSSSNYSTSKKSTKERYDSSGNPTGERYTINKDGNMNKWGRDKIRMEGSAPKSSVPKNDRTQV